MNTLITFIFLFLSAFSFANETPVEQEPPAQTPAEDIQIDVEELQGVLSSLATDITDTFDYLVSGELLIDQEFTNIDQGKFRIKLGAETTPLPWATVEEPVSVKVSAKAQTDVTVDPETQNKKVTVTGEVLLETNIMGLLKHTAETFGECELIPEEDIKNDDDKFSNLFCMALNGIKSSATVKELKPHLDRIVEYAKEILENDQEKNEAILKIIEALTIVETENSLNISTIIDIEAFNIKTDKLNLILEDNQIKFEFSGTAELKEEEFNSYLSDLKGLLSQILDQENDDSFYYVIEDYAFLIFGALEGIIVP